MKRFGFDDAAVPNDLSLALGAGGVAPVTVAAGYATFANGGYKVTPYFIDRVTTADGEVLYETQAAVSVPSAIRRPRHRCSSSPRSRSSSPISTELYPTQRAAPRIISPQNAYLICDMLWDVVRRGTGGRAARARAQRSGRQDGHDERRPRYLVRRLQRRLVGASWVGFDHFRPLGGNEQGGRTAIPMWIDFMAEALAGMPERAETPARHRRVPHQSDDRARSPTTARSNSIFEKFDIDHLPEREQSGFGEPLDPLDPGAGARPRRRTDF